jgi:hypothetical protein
VECSIPPGRPVYALGFTEEAKPRSNLFRKWSTANRRRACGWSVFADVKKRSLPMVKELILSGSELLTQCGHCAPMTSMQQRLGNLSADVEGKRIQYCDSTLSKNALEPP